MGYPQGTPFRFLQASVGVKFTSDGRSVVVTSAGTKFRSIITGSSPDSVWHMKCRVHKSKQWTFLGIGADIDLTSQSSIRASTSYGWSIQQQFIKGKHQDLRAEMWEPGSWVLVKADFQKGRLSLVSSHVTAAVHISLDAAAVRLEHKYVFHVILYDEHDEVELLPVTAQDHQMLA